jgi:hypothetical protein
MIFSYSRIKITSISPTPKVIDVITFPSDEALLQFQAGAG